MATVDWVYPITSTISGTTYIKDTDDKIQAAMDDLTTWVNSTGSYTTTGLAQSFVDLTTAQSIAGAKTFTDPLVGTTGTFTGQVTTITPVADTDATNKVYVDNAFENLGLSGTYIPSVTLDSNIDSTIPYTSRYIRVGNVVMVSGSMNINSTSIGDASFFLSLPIAPSVNFSTFSEASGTFSVHEDSVNGTAGRILSQAGTNTVRIRYTTAYTSAGIVGDFTFSYSVE